MLNRQVSWWSVHQHVSALLDEVGWWPMAGTPAWCELADDDPRKLASLYDAARHWALRVETCQQAECEASRDVSAAADWHGLARGVLQRAHAAAAGAYIPRKVAP